jgi:predicted CXXCH cytochrome family protein
MDIARLVRRAAALAPILASLSFAGGLEALAAGKNGPAPEQGRVAGTPAAGSQDKAVAAPAEYVGSKACVQCHKTEFDAWKGSHHELAMQHASAASVLGDFSPGRHTYNGVTTTFSKRGDRFYVNTDGPDGKLRDYEIKYTFGVYPLQQYLVEFPGGRLQALGVAWDARPKNEGGQKWFHLYPKEKVDHRDELHWTRLSQNWNHMCAECHSTKLRKNYDVASDRFRTTWSEINVACEACHGPASRHVAWADKRPGWEQDALKGLPLLLDERRDVQWVFSGTADTAARSRQRTTTREIETCARCHARRSTLVEGDADGRPLMDSHLPSVLASPLFYPDGQIKEEDFEYASFIQSRMFHEGVTCSDCHEPHGAKLRAPGNATCLRCHKAEKFDSAKHHFHPAKSKGASCAGCHMPTTNFMVVHPRHDHSIRIPRPDLSVKLKTPNACNQCHADKSAKWADAQMTKWYGPDRATGWHFGETLFEGRQGVPSAGQDLVAVALSPKSADIARASAAALLPGYQDPTVAMALPRLLADKSPMVRREALGIVDVVPPEHRWRLAGAALSDPVLAVRIEAARVLSVLPRQTLTPAQLQARDKAVQEYVAAALTSAEHPQSHVNLGLLYQRLGEPDRAEKAYLEAIRLGPAYAAGYVNLADFYRLQREDARAETTLLKGRAAVGDDAGIEHALGLNYVRSRQMDKAMQSLAKAARLRPDDARYGYVYAVALNDSGEPGKAVKLLEEVNARHPYDRDVLVALVTFHKGMGNAKAATRYAEKLAAMDPRYGSADQLMRQLSPR